MCLHCVKEVGTTQAFLSPTPPHPHLCFHPLLGRIPVPGDPGTRRNCERLGQSFTVSLCRGPGPSQHVEKVKTCISFPSLRSVGLGSWDTEGKNVGGENISSSTFLVGVNSGGSHPDPNLLSAQGAAQAPPLGGKFPQVESVAGSDPTVVHAVPQECVLQPRLPPTTPPSRERVLCSLFSIRTLPSGRTFWSQFLMTEPQLHPRRL